MKASSIDLFTKKRLVKFVEDFRASGGVLPQLTDFEAAHFSRAIIDRAVREGLLEQLYVTLTNGTVVKGYKAKP